MSDVPGWASLVTTVVLAAGNLAWTERRHRQTLTRQRALGPNPERLHSTLLEARDHVEAIRDAGGWTRGAFDGNLAGSLDRRLSDYADGVADDSLRELTHEAAADVEKLMLMAPVGKTDQVGVNRQVAYATEHLSCVEAAIVRFNEVSTGRSLDED